MQAGLAAGEQADAKRDMSTTKAMRQTAIIIFRDRAIFFI